MPYTDIGGQNISLKFGAAGNSREINERFVDIRPTGIYDGGYLTVVDTSHARISALKCEIEDGTHQIRAETTTTVTLVVSSAAPYIVLRWAYTGSNNDYIGLLAVASGSIQTYDLIVGKCTFTGGGALNGFLYTERSNPAVVHLFLKVEVAEEGGLYVRVRAGRIQNGKETIQIPDQKSTIFVPPGTNSRIDLVYVDRTTGTVSIDSSGTAAISPVAPNYVGKLVLAEVTLSAGDLSIAASAIEDVRDFTNMSYPVDDSTLNVNATGELEIKSGVLGQASQASGTTNISIASETFADLDNMTINMTTTGGKLLLLFSSAFRGDGVNLRFSIDGTPTVAMRNYFDTSLTGLEKWAAVQWLVNSLVAGVHVLKVQWARPTGISGTVYQDGISFERTFSAIELPHNT